MPEMNEMNDRLELVLGIYSEEVRAKRVLKSLEQLQQQRQLVLTSTAIVVRTPSGQLLTRQIVDWNLTEGGLIDGFTAALMALLNPVGALGAIAFHSGGLSVDVLLDHLAEMGVDAAAVQALAQALKPGYALLMALTQPARSTRHPAAEMEPFGAMLLRKTLASSLQANLGNRLIELARAVTLEQSQQTERFQ